MGVPTGEKHYELLQAPYALRLYAQLSFIRPQRLRVSSDEYLLSLRSISPCISAHTEIIA
jgi:hypothetical protein